MLKVFRGRRHFAHLFYGDSTHLINVFLNKVGRFDAMHMVDDGTATLHHARQVAEELARRTCSARISLYRHPLASRLLAGLGLNSTFNYQAKFSLRSTTFPAGPEGPVVTNTLNFAAPASAINRAPARSGSSAATSAARC